MKILFKYIALILGLTSGLEPMEVTEENLFKGHSLPVEIKIRIIKEAAISFVRNEGHAGAVGGVCKDWYRFIKDNRPSNFPFYKTPHNIEESCLIDIFLGGKLIYTPQTGEKIVLWIKDMVNPLESKFDLSNCGDTSQYLTISTGYRRRKNPENTYKVEIWFAPRFLIKKELNSGARHFKALFPNHWKNTAPVGIFWTYGSWENLGWYDHLTIQALPSLSNNTIYEKWSHEAMLRCRGYFGSYSMLALNRHPFICAFE